MLSVTVSVMPDHAAHVLVGGSLFDAVAKHQATIQPSPGARGE